MAHYLTLEALKYFCIKNGDQKCFFNLKSSYMSLLALSASFEYLCCGSTAIINILILSVRDRRYSQNLMYKDGPCAEMVNLKLATIYICMIKCWY